MTADEKVTLIDSLAEQEVNAENFAVLQAFSNDADAFVRSRCAAVLVNYKGDEAFRLLLQLANDEDAFVRTEAYDSLALYPCREAELVLRHSIYPEDDALAVRYAVLSWADVTVQLHKTYAEQTAFVQKLLLDTEFEDCCPECYYALHRFGMKSAVDKLLEFLDNADYIVRCSVLNLCMDIADEENAATIEAAVRSLLKTEEIRAVISETETLLAHLAKLQGKEGNT